MKRDMYYIGVILLLIIGLFLYREFAPPKIVAEETVRVDTIKYNTTTYIPKTDTLIKYENIYHSKVDTMYLPTDIDTLEILKDYFAKVIYKDTILNDTVGLITIYDTIYMNRLVSRVVHKKFFKSTIIEQPKLRNKVFVGLGVNGWTDKFGASANLGLLTKRDNLYIIGYDPINKSLSLSMYWKLKLKK